MSIHSISGLGLHFLAAARRSRGLAADSSSVMQSTSLMTLFLPLDLGTIVIDQHLHHHQEDYLDVKDGVGPFLEDLVLLSCCWAVVRGSQDPSLWRTISCSSSSSLGDLKYRGLQPPASCYHRALTWLDLGRIRQSVEIWAPLTYYRPKYYN